MVTEAIIISIDQKNNTCQVRIPLFEPAGGFPDISTAHFVSQPGLYNGFQVGDYVWVAFERNRADIPVVIGKMYRGVEKEKAAPGGALKGVDLEITNSAKIPLTTELSGYNANDIKRKKYTSISNIVERVVKLSDIAGIDDKNEKEYDGYRVIISFTLSAQPTTVYKMVLHTQKEYKTTDSLAAMIYERKKEKSDNMYSYMPAEILLTGKNYFGVTVDLVGNKYSWKILYKYDTTTSYSYTVIDIQDIDSIHLIKI